MRAFFLSRPVEAHWQQWEFHRKPRCHKFCCDRFQEIEPQSANRQADRLSYLLFMFRVFSNALTHASVHFSAERKFIYGAINLIHLPTPQSNERFLAAAFCHKRLAPRRQPESQRYSTSRIFKRPSLNFPVPVTYAFYVRWSKQSTREIYLPWCPGRVSIVSKRNLRTPSFHYSRARCFFINYQ